MRIGALQEENSGLHLNFAILLMANSLNLNSSYLYIFTNLFMIVYIIEIQKSNSLIFNSVKLNSM